MSDVAVIGGGIVGLATALALARAGADVTVWESGRPGSGASRRAHGEVVPPRAELHPLWRMSVAFYDELMDDGPFDWDRSPIGTLLVAGEEGHVPHLETRRIGDGDEVLDGGALDALGVTGAGGLLLTQGARLHPPALIGVLASAVRRAGGVIRRGMVVDLCEERFGGWELTTAEGDRFAHSRIVIAAGLQSRGLAASVGRDIPLVGITGRILVTEPQPPVLQHVVADCCLGLSSTVDADRGTSHATTRQPPALEPSVALLAHQRRDGRLLIGGSWSMPGSDLAHVDARIAAHASARLPWLGKIRFSRSWSGVRPCSPDGLPVIDELAAGLFACCGHGGEGFIAGPGSAVLLSQILLDEEPFTDARVFRLDRLSPTEHEVLR